MRPKSTFQTIEVTARAPSKDGKLLQLPDDFPPADHNPAIMEDCAPDVGDRMKRTIVALQQEEENAREAGMTVEELRYYQDLLLKKF